MYTCRDCQYFFKNPEIVNGECQKLKRIMHIDDECEYEIQEKFIEIHKDVDKYLKEKEDKCTK